MQPDISYHRVQRNYMYMSLYTELLLHDKRQDRGLPSSWHSQNIPYINHRNHSNSMDKEKSNKWNEF